MYAMTKADKLLLEVYKAIGTPDEIIRRLDSPYPDADEGYSPLPMSEMGCPFDDGCGIISDVEKVRKILNVYPAKPTSGLLEDDGMGSCPFEDDSCTISINDWEE